MMLSELIPLLQKHLDEHGDMLVGWDSEGRLFSFDEDDICIESGVDHERVWSGHVAPGERMLLLGDD